jgi:hypothetical protein
MNEVAGEDWLLRFLAEFASMSEQARDEAIDALAPERREALLALAEARPCAGWRCSGWRWRAPRPPTRI